VPANQMLWLFFGFSGRISRAAYFLAGLLMMIVVVFLVYRLTLAQESGGGAFWETLLSAVMIASLWAQAALGAKRVHDIDKPGLFAALLFVPLLNFIVFVALCLIPGTPGANQYGQTTNRPK
jgi:uncharacterized membrane protein YhaH (DUF805 family)